MAHVLLAVLLGATITHAADQTILGTQLLVKDPGVATKRKVVGKAKEKASPDTLVGDPTVDGANLYVRAEGGTTSEQIFPLPQGTSAITGKPFWAGSTAKGFKYKDSKGENGPVKTAQIKKTASGVFSLKFKVDGKLGPVTVLPPDPGDGGCVIIQLVNGDLYHVLFAPGEGKVTNKGAALFKVKKPMNEGYCFPPSTTSSSTTSSTSTSTTSSTSTSTSTSSTTSTTIDCTMFAGPSYPPVCGDNQFSFSGNPGDVGGRLVDYFNFSPSSGWTQLYWGVYAPFTPTAGLDGIAHTLSFAGISGGGSVVTWSGTSGWTDPVGPTYYPNVPIQLTITVTAGGVSWVDSTLIPGLDPGLGTGIGAVIDVAPGGTAIAYQVKLEFTADIPTDDPTGFIPASTVPQTGGGLTNTSYSGGFYSQQ